MLYLKPYLCNILMSHVVAIIASMLEIRVICNLYNSGMFLNGPLSSISFFTISAQILARSLTNVYRQETDRHKNL